VQTDQPGGYYPGFGNSLHIVVSPEHFAWLSKQCRILGTSKQALIANALQEWLPRNSASAISDLGVSAVVEMALSDFILRHRSEFIPVDEEEV
jgi:hypothetical protein